MSQSNEGLVGELEDRLRAAMLRGGVEELETLLAPDLLFTNHLGLVVSKQDDLDAYRSGALKITELVPSEQRIRKVGDAFVVSVRMLIRGTYAGTPANGDFRFTRVWAPANDNWVVVAAHAGLIV